MIFRNFSLLISICLLSFGCQDNMDELTLSEEKNDRDQPTANLRSSKPDLYISTFDPSFQDPGKEWDDVKVYFGQDPGVACYVKVVTSNNEFYTPTGRYIFSPTSREVIRSMMSDVNTLCTGDNSGYITKDVTFEIDGVYRLDNDNDITNDFDILVDSATGTMGTYCNDIDDEGPGGPGFGG